MFSTPRCFLLCEMPVLVFCSVFSHVIFFLFFCKVSVDFFLHNLNINLLLALDVANISLPLCSLYLRFFHKEILKNFNTIKYIILFCYIWHFLCHV